jgi:hypothetical protein
MAANGAGNAPNEGSKPEERHDGSRSTATRPVERSSADHFRESNQAQQLADPRTNGAAKTVAALDAIINQKFGETSAQAAQLKGAVRHSVEQTLDQGREIPPPRLRAAEPEQQRIQAEQQTRAPEPQDRDRDA